MRRIGRESVFLGSKVRWQRMAKITRMWGILKFYIGAIRDNSLAIRTGIKLADG